MRYYFLGIAGTAMASLAVLLKQKGHEVWGTDTGIYPPMSDFLAANNIPVWEGFDEAHLNTPFDRAVIGNAMPRGNVEIETILSRRLPMISMAELIRNEFAQPLKSVVITGTHGKTTTTSLMSWILEVAEKDPTCLIGGIAKNLDSSVKLGCGDHFVIEGDEYDTAFFDKRPKFVHYFPHYLIINNIEFDHADIYPDLDTIIREFKKLIRIMPNDGLIVANADSPAVHATLSPIYSRLQLFGKKRSHHWSYEVLSQTAHISEFMIYEKGAPVTKQPFQFPFAGEFQVQNATAAAAIARDIGVDWETIRKAFHTFKGVKRRMEYWGQLYGADVYDDFAHHPTAIRVTLDAVKQKFPGRRIVALFEPRTNTTVRNFFQQELAEALASADVVILTPLHRMEKIPPNQRLSLEKLTADLQQHQTISVVLQKHDEIPSTLAKVLQQGDILLVLTNGSLGGQYQQLREMVS
jgi:UDP-N-acetylmuramate: L-alanyl-gamma-D-glutamyl-meso-diaminopimelate ligase